MDNNFVEDKFLIYVDNIYIKILHAIMFDKLDTIKHFINDKLYNELKEKIINLKEKNLIDMYEMTNVKEANIIEFKEINEKYIIKVKLISRYINYKMDKDSKKIIGNNKDRIQKENILTFEKNINTNIQNASRKCPNCGANMDINKNGKCEYCGSIYNLYDYDYILTSIE